MTLSGLAPGIHDGITAADYHNGSTDTPSLSSSIARLLVTKSPAHARAAHPVLNPDLVRKDESKYEIGTAAHALFLEGEDRIAVFAGDAWRTNDAKDFRDEARATGQVPLLLEHAGDVRSMVAEAVAQLDKHRAKPPLFSDGKPEQSLVWEDDHGVICRARLDWLRDDHSAIDDYKTTSASADPEKWTRTMYGMGADMQVAFYMRGVEKLTGVRPQFRFAVQEVYPPYALSVVDLAPSALGLAEEKVAKAIDLWAVCLERDFWPAYPDGVASIELPGWEEERWLQSEVAA